MKNKIFPALIVIIGLLLIGPFYTPEIKSDGFNFAKWSQIPVLEGGRIKPIDSIARSYLLMFHGKQSLGYQDQKIPAKEWMAHLLMNREKAADFPSFRIDHPEVKNLIDRSDQKYFSYNDLEPYLANIQQQARLVPENSKDRDAYQNALVSLFGNLIRYQKLSTAFYPLEVNKIQPETFLKLLEPSMMEDRSPSEKTLILTLKTTPSDLILPIPDPQELSQWKTFPATLTSESTAQEEAKIVAVFIIESIKAFQSQDTVAFNDTIDKWVDFSKKLEPVGFGFQLEILYNKLQLFYQSLALYIWIGLIALFGLLFDNSKIHRPAMILFTIALILQTIGICSRIFITGYAPVTNLYSSAVFVGWVAVCLSFLMEKYHRNYLGMLVASTVGVTTLIIAHHLSDNGDTMEMMRAVLDSNFWLTTHVITITMGYGANFLAGFLAILYLLTQLLRKLTADLHLSLKRMVYAAICFSLLFSFIGTVLGGIWADQSWGRFWGWDPKENGALMIVLWNALILHALKCHWSKTRGLMTMAIGGNMITAWSWFGTNMLGVGLHSYGFMNSAFFWLILFFASQVFLIGLFYLFPAYRSSPLAHE